MNRAGTRLFYRESVTTDTGNALIFVSSETISALIDSTELLIDGTFRCVPEVFKQMVSIHAVKNEQVLFNNPKF